MNDFVRAPAYADTLEPLRQALDVEYMQRFARSILNKELPSEDPLSAYIELSKDGGVVNPNEVFSEVFYRLEYPDVSRAVSDKVFLSGLQHFVFHGAFEGRYPNETFKRTIEQSTSPLSLDNDHDAIVRLIEGNALLSRFSQFFPSLSIDSIYKEYARFFFSGDATRPSFRAILSATFDPEFFRKKYGFGSEFTVADLISIYLSKVAAEEYSPNPQFDEKFYRAFYVDIRDAVKAGRLLCGYQHYLLSGKAEGRLPQYRLESTLEQKYYGITRPVAFDRVRDIQRRLAAPPIVQTRDHQRTLHLVVPDLNPDLFFGGYRSLIELAKQLHKRGSRMSVVKTESEDESLNYFFYHAAEEESAAFRDAQVYTAKTGVRIGPNDRFLCYSAWDVLFARNLVKKTNHERVSFLVQEYEPIFLEHNALHYMVSSAYAYPHFPVFNSEVLKRYFREHRIGVFANDPPAPHTCFQHCVTSIRPPVAETPSQKTLLFYARPEMHAGRNMFEVGVMALRAAVEANVFTDDWRFVGVGAMRDHPPYHLAGPHWLEIRARVPIAEYQELMENVVVGLSLMHAPHPSVVPYEMLQVGAQVVTNSFENRSAAELERISPNFIPAGATIESVVDAIRKAVARVSAGASRLGSARRIGPSSWDAALQGALRDLEAEDQI
ncbi:rhamnosyltransferase WsaF family glycosyltransferase [Faunimonas sp. B44]|uniref:rhamnosyltransferase WsaF family glycosyltransferase n=1 Tax=Faunimonas sp. B44 TaxID=3461493 RepID=UPI004044973A